MGGNRKTLAVAMALAFVSTLPGNLPSLTPTATPTATATVFETSYASFGSTGGTFSEGHGGALYFTPIRIDMLSPFDNTISAGVQFGPSATGNFRLASYADNGGKPGAMIAQTALYPANSGWNYLPLGSATSGWVWIAVWTESASCTLYYSSTPSFSWPSYRMDSISAGPLPALFDSACAIPYAFVRFDTVVSKSYWTGASATPTFTATASPTFCGACTQTMTTTPTPTFTLFVPCLPSQTQTPAISETGTDTYTPCPACSPTFSATPTSSPAATFTVTPTSTPTSTSSITFTASASPIPTAIRSGTPTWTPTFTATPTATSSGTPTISSTLTSNFTSTLTPCACTLSETTTMTPTPTPTHTMASCVALATPMCAWILVYAPVCGCNGVTYSNSSEAGCYGITVYTTGVCATATPALASVPPGTSFSYPSPATGNSVDIGFNMASPGTAKVQILNSSGALLSEVTQYLGAGPGSVSADITGYAFGMYYYRISMTYDDGRSESLPVGTFAVAH